jgi:hypothetical protein
MEARSLRARYVTFEWRSRRLFDAAFAVDCIPLPQASVGFAMTFTTWRRTTPGVSPRACRYFRRELRSFRVCRSDGKTMASGKGSNVRFRHHVRGIQGFFA